MPNNSIVIKFYRTAEMNLYVYVNVMYLVFSNTEIIWTASSIEDEIVLFIKLIGAIGHRISSLVNK
jgi:hypothetical protein